VSVRPRKPIVLFKPTILEVISAKRKGGSYAPQCAGDH
jgi:hypothetical protein